MDKLFKYQRFKQQCATFICSVLIAGTLSKCMKTRYFPRQISESTVLPQIGVSNSYTSELKNKTGLIVTLVGWRHLSKTRKERVTVGHVLFMINPRLYRQYSLNGSFDFSITRSGDTEESTVYRLTKLDPGQKLCDPYVEECIQKMLNLRVEYESDPQTLWAGDDIFYRRDGNLLVVRVGEDLDMKAYQLPQTHEKLSRPSEILQLYKNALRDDQFLRTLSVSKQSDKGADCEAMGILCLFR
jgi:hypothetical protein